MNLAEQVLRLTVVFFIQFHTEPNGQTKEGFQIKVNPQFKGLQFIGNPLHPLLSNSSWLFHYLLGGGNPLTVVDCF